MSICNPIARVCFRRANLSAALALLAVLGFAHRAAAQQIQLLQDTETERVLRAYEDPIYKAAGLDPAALHMYIVNDQSLNAFAAGGQNIFVNSGLFIQLRTPNELIGVLAHETGHIAGGHMERGTDQMRKATVPLLLSMVVGLAAGIAGSADAASAIMMSGPTLAQAQFDSFSRAQEATADQMGQKFLRLTHQSGEGMVHVFERMADERARATLHPSAFATDHPADRDRVDALQEVADSSPYANVPDSPEAQHEFDMIKAKMIGYLEPVDTVLLLYPLKNQSKPARYARSMAYLRKPDLKAALTETESLIKDEPNNPYFYEVLGQAYVEMSQPEKGIAPYQKAVDLLPDAPELRTALAAAQLAMERKDLAQKAVDNLKVALQENDEDSFGWYELAAGYSLLGNQPMADLATAERYYAQGNGNCLLFAKRAAKALPEGSAEWQRASDIVAIVTPLVRKSRE